MVIVVTVARTALTDGATQIHVSVRNLRKRCELKMQNENCAIAPKASSIFLPINRISRNACMLLWAMPVIFLMLATQVRAQQTTSPDFSSIDRIMDSALKANTVPGAVVFVGHDGQSSSAAPTACARSIRHPRR